MIKAIFEMITFVLIRSMYSYNTVWLNFVDLPVCIPGYSDQPNLPVQGRLMTVPACTDC